MKICFDHRSITQARLARRCQRYNLDFSELPLRSQDHVPNLQPARVERKIKMRISHTCHLCQTKLSRNRICRTCQHRLCPQCSRNPPRRLNHNLRSKKYHNYAETPSDLILNDTGNCNLCNSTKAYRSSLYQIPEHGIPYQCHTCDMLTVIGVVDYCPACCP